MNKVDSLRNGLWMGINAARVTANIVWGWGWRGWWGGVGWMDCSFFRFLESILRQLGLNIDFSRFHIKILQVWKPFWGAAYCRARKGEDRGVGPDEPPHWMECSMSSLGWASWSPYALDLYGIRYRNRCRLTFRKESLLMIMDLVGKCLLYWTNGSLLVYEKLINTNA